MSPNTTALAPTMGRPGPALSIWFQARPDPAEVDWKALSSNVDRIIVPAPSVDAWLNPEQRAAWTSEVVQKCGPMMLLARQHKVQFWLHLWGATGTGDRLIEKIEDTGPAIDEYKQLLGLGIAGYVVDLELYALQISGDYHLKPEAFSSTYMAAHSRALVRLFGGRPVALYGAAADIAHRNWLKGLWGYQTADAGAFRPKEWLDIEPGLTTVIAEQAKRVRRLSRKVLPAAAGNFCAAAWMQLPAAGLAFKDKLRRMKRICEANTVVGCGTYIYDETGRFGGTDAGVLASLRR